MRPSWPPPMIPMVEPGAIIPGLRPPIRSAPRARPRAARPSASSPVREHRGGEQRGVDRARLADRQRSDRNAGGHLDDREEAIHALERLGFDRHSEHRKRGHRGGHPGQVRCAAGARDHELEPALLGRMGIFVKPLGRPVRGDDLASRARTPSWSSVSAAWRIVSQSELLPMMMPTSGSVIVPP